jgi:hypothetical protein
MCFEIKIPFAIWGLISKVDPVILCMLFSFSPHMLHVPPISRNYFLQQLAIIIGLQIMKLFFMQAHSIIFDLPAGISTG